MDPVIAMRRVALLTLVAFGCTTARQPATPMAAYEAPPAGPVAVRVALAEPELELWMEGTGPVDPAESARALEQSRDALSEALAGRGLEASDPEALLVVHARAIARTDERKSAQIWSVVGIVVVVVAVVVIAIISSRSRSSPKATQAVRPVRSVRPGPYAPAYLPRRYPPPPPFGINVGLAVEIPLSTESPAPWVTPTESWLASRGWFDGDETELTVELVDAHTGAPRWHDTVRAGIDPRDAGAVSRLVDRALAGQTFGARTERAPPLDELPPPPAPPVSPDAAPAPPEASSTPPAETQKR